MMKRLPFLKNHKIVFAFVLCSSVTQMMEAQVYPLSDPINEGNWVINQDVSDEFNNGALDKSKWDIQGEDGNYKSNFIGRAPSQFSTENAIVEQDKLKILTKWEPDFDFSDTPQDGVKYENITTAAVISKNQFHYGYMEIRCKAANAEITSSFWTTGYRSELDMFEMFGGAKDGNADAWKKRLKYNMISWDPENPYYLPDGNGPAYTTNIQVDHNTADDFHVYGFDWTPNYIKIYVDGELHENGTILRSELGEERWVTNVPYWIWFDSETFPWLGIPEEADLPAEYEIDYIRVWDKKNLLDSDYFGFEKDIEIDGVEYNWYIPDNGRENLNVTSEKASRWDRSLKFEHSGALPNNIVAFAPFKSVVLEADEYTFSMQVYIEPDSDIKSFQVIFEDPWTVLDFDVSNVETGKWVTISEAFTRNIASGDKDRIRVLFKPTDVTAETGTLYIDEIYVNKANRLNVKDNISVNNSSKVYPNPINKSLGSNLKVNAPNANELVLYNVTGVEVLRLYKSAEPFSFSVENLPSGMYFLNVISDKTSEVKKIIIN